MKRKYIKLSEYANRKSITYRTAWTHFKKGLIKDAYQDESGSIILPESNFHSFNDCVLYSRVSSNEMKENLSRQEERLLQYANNNNYNIVKSIKEIGSGMNDSRPKLNNILSETNWDVLIIENKDRLTRFGFNYIETLLNQLNKKIIVLNESNDNKTDLINDLVSIIYSFSARIYGLRRKKNKEEIMKFIESE